MSSEGKDRGELLTGGDLMRILKEEREKAERLPASDPDHPFGFEFDEAQQIWTIWWGEYEYWFEQDRVSSPEQLLDWIEHLTEKSWEGMTTYKLHRFIGSVKNRWVK